MKYFRNHIDSFSYVGKQYNLIIRKLEEPWAWIRRPTHGVATSKPFHENLSEIYITSALIWVDKLLSSHVLMLHLG